ncbi:hypothetical protein AB733_04825 [Photobacterium swingsii]|uniref:Uncharacterized protein n=1 Tax=Photobacterium swingsii TaxID=680026 RepID=A0A0J8VEC7_9GAMM|nr:hypothetical protein [Photobacterium swingsii]KMV31452.1 hypothetical protein AB733_04825 [Photobacterium swingsii]PSW25032.1 hypothetical protein C9I94_09510 [Photobacterium swingsii]
MKKKYIKPVIATSSFRVGLPTVLAVGAVAAAAGAASVAVGKMVGDITNIKASHNSGNLKVRGSNEKNVCIA